MSTRASSEDDSSQSFVPVLLLLMTAGFFLLLLPTAASGHYFFGDERFYTDAALRMAQKGEIIAPHYIDDLPHFNKPILTYWAVLASFDLFGIRLVASRIPSLLAGCATLLLTYRCGLALLQRRDESLLAAMILGTNAAFVPAVTRATPDALLTLSLTASFAGFSALLFGRERRLVDYLLAYGGAALAVEAKGLLGIVVLFYVFGFFALSRPRGVRFADLFEAKSITLAVFLAFSWFAIATLGYGSAVWRDFLGDQVTDRLVETHVSHFRSALFLLFATCQHFLPWTVLLVLSAIPGAGRIAEFWRQHRTACLFAVGWYAVLVLVFCMGAEPRGRYLLPAYPLLAVLLSGMLAATVREPSTVRLQRWIVTGILVALGLAGAALAVSGASIDPQLTVAGGAIAIASGFLLLWLHRTSGRGAIVVLGVAYSLVLGCSSGLVRPVFMDAPEEAMARELLGRGIRRGPIATVDLPPHSASHLWLFSGGLLASSPQREDVTASELARFPVILLSDEARGRLALDGYRVTPCGFEYPVWKGSDLWGLLSTSDKRQFMERKRRAYFIASRDPGP